MKLAALLSGGKDSLYAAYLAKKQGHEIKFIVSILSENAESYMFHVPNINLVNTQAEAMGLPLIEKRTKGQKEEELNDLRDVLSGIKGIDGVVSGALASNYQKTRIDKLCKELKLESVAPLWQINQETYLKNLIKDGFNAVIVAVAAPPLDEKWLGKSLNEQTVGELVALNKKHGISLVGEGGEFDTFVTDCPLFRKKIEIIDSEKVWDKKTRSGQLEIKKVKLADKHL
jgi:ABC transporter with metal-binding/Fe-S-binding domain ATP-binding protein